MKNKEYLQAMFSRGSDSNTQPEASKRKFFKSSIGKACLVLIVALVVFLIASGVSYCTKQSETSQDTQQITCLADIEGKTAGSLVGSACFENAQDLVGSSGEVLGFNTVADCFQALTSHKVDVCVLDQPATVAPVQLNPQLAELDEPVATLQYGAGFSKTEAKSQTLLSQFNEYLTKIKADGTLDELWNKWACADDSVKTIDKSKITGENGTITIATSSVTGKPDVYIKDNELAGLDIELGYRFCEEYGYTPEFLDVSFDGLIMGITTGKYDMTLTALSITEERKESIDFSDPYYNGYTAAIINTETGVSQTSYFGSIAESFKRTFVDENRWKLFATGALNTLIISVAALVFGTILGFLVFLFCRKGGRIRNKITDACIWLITGMPAVVLLMVLFYIVFANFNIGGLAVSIVAFTLIFAAGTVGMLRTGMDAIDDGQTEAGYALGYTDFQTFSKIILPQAIRHILPTFQSEVVELLKGTAIVGYIAVQDLTKVGDIVRSATYEAIFPLLAVAIMYFVLEALVKWGVHGLNYLLFERRRNKRAFLEGLVLISEDEGSFDDLKQEYIKTALDGKVANVEFGQLKKTAGDAALVDKTASTDEIAAADELATRVDAASKSTLASEDDVMLRIENMGKSYGDLEVLHDISTVVRRGEVISLIGGSGCGKSTFIRCLNYLDPPTTGRIFIQGEEITAPGYDVTKIRRKVGTIFQRWNLFEHWTVIENVMNPQIDLCGLSRQEAYDRSMKALIILGLGSKALNYPSELSGGQMQRVAIARTMMMDAPVVVLDEPTSALDPCMVAEIEVSLNFFAQHGRTMLVVSHDMKFVRSVSTRVFYLNDGRIFEEGTPEEIFDNPKLPETRMFINQVETKLLQLDKNSPDLIGAFAEVTDFCVLYRLSKQIEGNICSLLLKLCVGVIFPALSREDVAFVGLGHSDKTGAALFGMKYTGAEFDPSKHADAAQWAEIEALISSYEYDYDDEENCNMIFISL